MHSFFLRNLGRLLLLAALWASTAVADEFQKGIEAFNDEDYATALAVWTPLAEDGDVAAQFNVAMIYDFGEGVPEDNEKALYWYTAAARQADEQAQFNLGIMYANGEGVAIDHGESLKWYSLAAEHGNSIAKTTLVRCISLARASRKSRSKPTNGSLFPVSLATTMAGITAS